MENDNKTTYMKIAKPAGWLAFLGLIVFTVLSIFAPWLSGFAGIVGNVSMGFLSVWFVDKYIFGTIDTIEEIKKGNYTYALLWIAFAIIIGAAISAS